MRAQVVFIFRAFLMMWLCTAASVSYALAAQTPATARVGATEVESAVMRCDGVTRFWVDRSGALAVDRQLEIGAGIKTAMYRLDDKNGYWLFPATNASKVLIPLPDGIGTSFNLSIAEAITADGVAKPCALSANGKTGWGSHVPPSYEGSAVEHLAPTSHTIDSAPCEAPFVPARPVKSVPPVFPTQAAIQRITGTVDVLVDLDSTGVERAATILISPSPLLNDASITAARQSRFSPAIFRCEPVASRYIYIVEYDSQ